MESRYGTDLRMWRLDDINGPQGPMQVSAAAAFDVGGGDRFNVYENILLGRAYLARLLRRYGSWSDALAAYNWGPGNVDQWIARGRKSGAAPRGDGPLHRTRPATGVHGIDRGKNVAVAHIEALLTRLPDRYRLPDLPVEGHLANKQDFTGIM